MTPVELLKKLDCCRKGLAWAEQQTGSAEEMWNTCDRGDWLLWMAGKSGLPPQRIVLAAVPCARMALNEGTEVDPKRALDKVEAWAKGEATTREVFIEYTDVWTAYVGSRLNAKTTSAIVAVIDATRYSRRWVAYAAASSAAHFLDPDIPSEATLEHCAHLVREVISWAEVRAALKAAA